MTLRDLDGVLTIGTHAAGSVTQFQSYNIEGSHYGDHMKLSGCNDTVTRVAGTRVAGRII